MLIEEYDMLTRDQIKQVEYQIELHKQCVQISSLDSIPLDQKTKIENLVIYPGVLRPMSSKHLAAYLFRNGVFFKGSSVIDIGSGCGIQGITTALCGARNVILSDLIEAANLNTLQNVSRLSLSDTCEVRRGDLFENIPEVVDYLIFAQPYFSGVPDPEHPFTYGMLDSGDLIHRFLDQAKHHFRKRIFMCYLDLAGDTNNPAIQAPKHGYTVIEHGPELLETGEQKGKFWVHELLLK